MDAAPEPGNGGSLREQLEELISGHLIELQRLGERERMREILIEIWDPDSGEGFEQASLAFRRMARVQKILRGAARSRRLFPWVLLPAAAAAFEGIYVQSVLFWLSVPPPEDVDRLAPSVDQLISLQVGFFTGALGA